jgi:hypothetical protein
VRFLSSYRRAIMVGFKLCLIAFASAVSPSLTADPFLHKQIRDDAFLLKSIESALGGDGLRGRVDKLHARLRPLFLSLPKNSKHLLSHAAARYALHRIIVEMHGWSIAGLEPNASTFNTTSLVGSGMLRSIVPEHIEYIFEDGVGGDGFTLQALAVLAATVEHLVHDHQQMIVRRVCELFGFPTAGAMNLQDVRTVVHLYKAVFLIGAGDENIDLSTFTAPLARRLLEEAPERYPGWDDTALFLDDEIATFAFNTRSQNNPFRSREGSLEMALGVVERAADHFPRQVAEPECQEIKEDLLAFETGDSGRIRLADFYRAGLTSRFFYVETKDFLRDLGALDESDYVHGPKVIVSNYVLSKVNCLAHSHTYSICCINECDHLYSQLEDAAAGYEATPRRIASIVAALSSSTVQAPRNLSQSLLERLDDIASSNSGNVLLHSRLFAQWLHQAFPRECQYPHLTGTTTSLSPDAWSERHGVPYRIDHVPGTRMKVLNTSIEMLDREVAARHGGGEPDVGDTEDLMWSLDEEVFAPPTPSLSKRLTSMVCSWSASVGYLAGFLGLLVAIAAKAKLLFSTKESEKKPLCVFV